ENGQFDGQKQPIDEQRPLTPDRAKLERIIQHRNVRPRKHYLDLLPITCTVPGHWQAHREEIMKWLAVFVLASLSLVGAAQAQSVDDIISKGKIAIAVDP